MSLQGIQQIKDSTSAVKPHKMRLTVHTERGSFVGMEIESTEDASEYMQERVERAIESGDFFSLRTGTGFVVLAADLLKTAAFVVES